MVEIIFGIALFTATVMALVLIIVAVRSKLTPKGQVSITINDERRGDVPISVEKGEAGIVG